MPTTARCYVATVTASKERIEHDINEKQLPYPIIKCGSSVLISVVDVAGASDTVGEPLNVTTYIAGPGYGGFA